MSEHVNRYHLIGGYTLYNMGLLLSGSHLYVVAFLQIYYLFMKLPRTYEESQEYRTFLIVIGIGFAITLLMHSFSFIDFNGLKLVGVQSFGIVMFCSRLLAFRGANSKNSSK